MDLEMRSSERHEYLAFSLTTGAYAVPVLKVREILQYQTITTLPSAPPFIRGVLNLRGRVVPVVDLEVRFGLPASPVTKRTCVLVVEAAVGGASFVVGLIADAVNQVVEVAAEQIEPPPRLATGGKADFVEGIGKLASELVLILDIDRVLTPQEHAQAAEAAAELGGDVVAAAG